MARFLLTKSRIGGMGYVWENENEKRVERRLMSYGLWPMSCAEKPTLNLIALNWVGLHTEISFETTWLPFYNLVTVLCQTGHFIKSRQQTKSSSKLLI